MTQAPSAFAVLPVDAAEQYHSVLGPAFLMPLADDLARRVAKHPPLTILETACGTGIATAALLKHNLGSQLVATDASPAMLEVAQAHALATPLLRITTTDMQTLPFETESFDAVACQLGLMFMPSRALAIQEAFRVLKYGGRFYFNVWDAIQKNPIHMTAQHDFSLLVPGFNELDMPFSMCNPSPVQRLLLDAGFVIERTKNVGVMGSVESVPALSRAMVSLAETAPNMAAIRLTDPSAIAAIEKRLSDDLAEVLGGVAHTMAPASVWVFVARKG